MKTYISFCLILLASLICVQTKISYYIVTERPTITHVNSSFFSFVNFTSVRKNRRSPMYYVDIHYVSTIPFDDTVDFYFYQFLSNEYRRSFVEMHFKWCNLIHKDPFFGSAMRQGNLTKPCPHQPISYYFITERATLTHVNSSIFSFVNFTSVRKNRRSPMYYVDIHYVSTIPFDDTVDFYFYQFLSNEYRRSFVEMHFKWCNLIHKDPFFGSTMRQGNLTKPCPHPPGEYHLYNMSIPVAAIPPGFPFEKGRIFSNFTWHGADMVGGYIDMELKEKRSRN